VNNSLVNVTRNAVLASKVRYCNRPWSRLRGLLATSKEDGEVCWLVPCKMIHTFGMRYPIDVLFLNKKNEVIAAIQNLKPNRLSPFVRAAHSVVEFSSGFYSEHALGDRLALEKAS